MAAGMPQSADLALGVNAGSEDGDLGRVEHGVLVGDVLVVVAVPVFAGLEGPAGGMVHEQLVFGFFEVDALAGGGIGDLLGLVDAEEPAVAVFRCGTEAVGDGGHGLAEADGVLDGLVHECGAGGLVHHGGGDVEARDEWIEGGGGAVHHEGFVELIEVERSARRLSLMWTMEPMEKAASILCVDCTEKMAGRSGMSSGTPMAKRLR